MHQKFHYKSLEDAGIYSGKDYFEFPINSLLTQRNLTESCYSKVLSALEDAYNSFVEFLSLNDPGLPEDLTWSQLKLLRMELDELSRERDYRLADYFCRKLADQVIEKEIKGCRKSEKAAPRKKNQF